MFDKRLIKMCPDSIKYIAGNVVLQWLELAANAVMIILIALTVQQIYDRSVTLYAFLTRLLICYGLCTAVYRPRSCKNELYGLANGQTRNA